MVLSQVEHIGVEAAGLRSGAAERPVCRGMTLSTMVTYYLTLVLAAG